MTDDTAAPKPDGGPMFPNPAVGWGGMTLRDWFAGQALSQGMSILVAHSHNLNEHQIGQLAKTAYMAADAMIAHRNATREG